jgi:hypothetical protein
LYRKSLIMRSHYDGYQMAIQDMEDIIIKHVNSLK